MRCYILNETINLIFNHKVHKGITQGSQRSMHSLKLLLNDNLMPVLVFFTNALPSILISSTELL